MGSQKDGVGGGGRKGAELSQVCVCVCVCVCVRVFVCVHVIATVLEAGHTEKCSIRKILQQAWMHAVSVEVRLAVPRKH